MVVERTIVLPPDRVFCVLCCVWLWLFSSSILALVRVKLVKCSFGSGTTSFAPFLLFLHPVSTHTHTHTHTQRHRERKKMQEEQGEGEAAFLSLGRISALPEWVNDEASAACQSCEREFTLTRRRHHVGVCVCVCVCVYGWWYG